MSEEVSRYSCKRRCAEIRETLNEDIMKGFSVTSTFIRQLHKIEYSMPMNIGLVIESI
jgi:hypothetical protein